MLLPFRARLPPPAGGVKNHTCNRDDDNRNVMTLDAEDDQQYVEHDLRDEQAFVHVSLHVSLQILCSCDDSPRGSVAASASRVVVPRGQDAQIGSLW